MSSSSAYNNVLLKQPVQTQAVAAPKRDTHNDYSNANFSHTFNDARDSLERESVKRESVKREVAQKENAQRDKVQRDRVQKDSVRRDDVQKDRAQHSNIKSKVDTFARPIAEKKATPVDHSRSKTESANTKRVTEESTSSSKDSSSDAACANENSIAEKNKKLGDKTASTKENKKQEDSNDQSLVATVLNPTPDTNSVSPGTAVTLAFGDGEPQTSDLALVSNGDASVDSVSGVAPDESDFSATDLISAGASTNSTNSLNNSVASDAINEAENAAHNPEQSQSVAWALPNTIDENVSAELAAQAAAVKLPASNASALNSDANIMASETTEASEASLEIPGTLVTDKSLATSSKNVTTDAVVAADAQQTPAEDPKSVFEKMLQTVAKTVGRDEAATPVSSQEHSSDSSSSSPLDSFARFNDAQTPAGRGFVVQTAVPVPVGQPQWSQAVGEKVLWLAAQNVSSAEINLHPKDLGPMQVRVSVNQEQTSVSFTSHHPMVREVLDQNLNRLRDMFSEQGLNLVNVDVSDKSFSRQQGEGKEQKGQSGSDNVNEAEVVTAVTTIIQQRLVDHYA